ncbi:unnamed protein product [Caenorhabditis bovis]|uniref:Carbonic anhydrase n=1 Tax=Caenorhabditis bovis TaxID=2654633 RepID=A0A8S1EBF5_9PELO|nr:unnamed protein product [Caenorhabditis bovis]
MIFWFLAIVIEIYCSSGEGWGYSEHDGPHTWPGACQNHQRQSPINIQADDIDYEVILALNFDNYEKSGKVEISNTGRTLLVSGFEKWKKKQPAIKGGGLKHRYVLSQFHLHWGQTDDVGSEHALGSLHYPGELHLVHIREDLTLEQALKKPDGIAVVAVFLANAGDVRNLNFDVIARHFPSLAYRGNKTIISGFHPVITLPSDTISFYRYEGSLTTPECEEVVIWTIMADPLLVSNEQLYHLRQIRNSENLISEKNYRPLQPMNGRRIAYRARKLDRSHFCTPPSHSYSINILLAFILPVLMRI